MSVQPEFQYDLSERFVCGATHLHVATHAVDLYRVMLLLKREDLDVNVKDMNGMTALHIAAEENHFELATVLLQHRDIDPNVKDGKGSAAIHFACGLGHVGVVRALIRHGNTDFNIKGSEDLTPFELACHGGHQEVVKVLLKSSNINVNAVNTTRITRELFAAHGDDAAGGHRQQERIHRVVADFGSNQILTTPLHLAVLGGHVAIVETLLKCEGIQVNPRMYNGYTPLYQAVESGDMAIVRALLRHKDINVNFRSYNGHTPLHEAVLRNSFDTPKLLLRDRTTLRTAPARYISIEIVKSLLSHRGIVVDARNEKGNTPLHLAVERNSCEAVYLLLKDGRVNKHAKNVNGFTALGLAEKLAHHGCINLLKA